MALWTESMELPAVKQGILSRWKTAVDDKTAKPRLDLGLALGSGDVILALPGQALRSPARVAVDGKDRIVAMGQQAFEMEGREPEGVRVIQPLREGVVVDGERARRLVESCLKTGAKTLMGSARAVLAWQSDLSAIERQTLLDTVRAAGVREVHFLDQALLAAVGADRPVLDARGSLVIHVGAGATQASVVALGSPVISRTIRVGGDHQNTVIREHLRRAHQVLIDEQTAEKVKRELGCALAFETPRRLQVAGRELVLGKPVEVEVTSDEICSVLAPLVAAIVEEARLAIAEISPELLRDVVEDGAVLTGGGANLARLDELLSSETRVRVVRVPEPQDAVARGLARVLREGKLRRALLTLPQQTLSFAVPRRRSSAWIPALALLVGTAALTLYFSDTLKSFQPLPLDAALNSMMKPAVTLAAAEPVDPPEKAALAASNRKLRELDAENKRLWRMAGRRAVTSSPAEAQALIARVLARDPRGWMSFLNLDAGSRLGVHKGMVVASPQGLVGQVFFVSEDGCRVRLFTDPGSIVAGTLPQRKTAGVLVGRGDRRLEMRYLDPDAGVKVGDKVVTSGQDGLFPMGLPLGRVSRILPQADSSFVTVMVEPACRFDALREVSIL